MINIIHRFTTQLMVKKFVVLYLLSIIPFAIFADTIPAVLKGNSLDYKNTPIKIYAYADYISHSTKVLAIDTVDSNGAFNIQLPLAETQQVFLDLGLFQGVLYLQPADQYEIILPEYSPKTMGEILNPFFQPTQIYLGIKDIQPNNLNYQIADFDELYNQFIDENYVLLFKRPNKHAIDSLLEGMEAVYDTVAGKYFKVYRDYKYAWLQFVSYKRDYRYIIRDFFDDKAIAYNNVAYMDLFNQLFTNYFSFYQNTKEGERLYSDIAYAKSPKFIAETFENSMVLMNDTLQELVMLKGIHDAFYSYDFPPSSLTITLDSIAELTKVNTHKIIAQDIKEKVFKAKAGYPTPGFELYDSKGEMVSGKDYLGDYVYLNFCSVESFTCQQDFGLIKAMLEKHEGEVKVVSISIDDDFEMAKAYFKNHGYDWPLLSYRNQKDILDAYKVRAYPSYYLIDEEGILKMSPAATPSENFEYQFFKMLEDKKRGTR